MAKGKKKAKSIEGISGSKKIVEKENPEEYKSKNPVWRFHRYDQDHQKWCINKKEFYASLMGKLISFEGMTWHQIESASGGKRTGTNHHFIPVSEIIKDAQLRLEELNIYYDELFSLRLSNKERLYGILENGVYHILWYDSEHEICPSAKRNT